MGQKPIVTLAEKKHAIGLLSRSTRSEPYMEPRPYLVGARVWTEGVMQISKLGVGERTRIFHLLRLISIIMYAICRQTQCVGITEYQIWARLTGSTWGLV